MDKYTVPEPEGYKKYSKKILHRIALKHKEQFGQLPYPDPVPERPLRNPKPSMLDKIWANKWQIARHFIILGGGAALAAVTGGASLAVAAGKTDLLTTVKNRITRTGGSGMGIRTEVAEFKAKLVELISIFFDETADKDQVMDIASGAWSAFNEAKDLKGLSKDDLYKAGADVGLDLAVIFGGKFIKYSDEVEPE